MRNLKSKPSETKLDSPTSTNSTGLFQINLFSRKNASNGTSAVRNNCEDLPKMPLRELHPSPLANIVHQADSNGKQYTELITRQHSVSTHRLNNESTGSSGPIRNLFANIWSALGTSEQEALKANKQSSSNQPIESSNSASNIPKYIIPAQDRYDIGKKCLVLDLDETLVHSSFKPTQNPDYIIPVEIDGVIHQVYVCKRPGVDFFLRDMSSIYEIVVYTASLSKYADPLLDRLDPENAIRFRLFREHCVQYDGNYVKDLSLLGRDLSKSIIVDNSPMSYLFHPLNAIGCSSFIDDINDHELDSISRFLRNINTVDDVRNHLHAWNVDY